MKQPKNPYHPGEIILEEFLKPLKMSQADFSNKLGWTKVKLNELVNGKRGITADSAIDLSKALGTSAKLWLDLQSTYDLDKAVKRRKAA